MEKGPLQQIVRQNPVFRKPSGETLSGGLHVYHALAAVAGAVEQVVVQLRRAGGVGVAARRSAENAGKGRGVCVPQGGNHLRLQQPVSPGDDPPVFVNHSPVQRVQQRARQRPDGIHSGNGVAVQRQQKCGPRQPPLCSGGDVHSCGRPPQQAHQLHQRAPLALPPPIEVIGGHILRLPGEEEKSVPIPAVQLLDPLLCLGDPLPFLRRRLCARVRQICQQAVAHVLSREAIGEPAALQLAAQLLCGKRMAQQGTDDAQGFSLPGNPLLQLQPEHLPPGDHMERRPIHGLFGKLRSGQQHQQCHPPAPPSPRCQHRECGAEGQHQNGIPGSVVILWGKQGKSQVFPLFFSLLCNGLCLFLLGQPVPPGQLCQPAPVAHASPGVHLCINLVPKKCLMNHAQPFQLSGPVPAGVQPQAVKAVLQHRRGILAVLPVLRQCADAVQDAQGQAGQ